MLKPAHQRIFKTVDELFESDYKIEFKEKTIEMLSDNSNFQKVMDDNRVINLTLEVFTGFQENILRKAATEESCTYYRDSIAKTRSGKSVFGMYQIPEVAYGRPERLFTGFFNPYAEKFQELMDRSLEAGLHKAWEIFFYNFFRHDFEASEVEKNILDFDAIVPFFFILVIGYLVGLLALFCETFYWLWKN
jgi:hypothetical protein